ncbi:hypothetical protein J3R30DRAFT_3455583 [Lentinula aciculospora]|uniref:Zn(2)-C6 fungal-type domain-containing protein n=1 Tax=Lentinula aciculospora TaxID=153920 RepID=A0A9W9AHJ4_9AGAR|nr:hypothetical protein J3R30DRAFT_3455583 [Lentinula aciculospora]
MLYAVEDMNQHIVDEFNFSNLQDNAHSLTSPGASASVHINHRPNVLTHGYYHSQYRPGSYTKLSYPDPGQSSSGNYYPVTPVHTVPHTFDPHASNNLAVSSAENFMSGTQEFPVSSLSHRREGSSIRLTTSHPSSIASMPRSWPPVEEIPTADPPKRHYRREKPKIALAPDQPPTTQGKPRARVYVACIQCRNRKIRCDGVKPICYNCGRKSSGGNDCNYDAAPKRRGPDKTPGARQRVARELKQELEINETRRRRRRREITPSRVSEVSMQTNHRDAIDGSISPESATINSMSSSSYTSPSISFTSPPINLPLYEGCSCHGFAHCPTSQPYVSPRGQMLPFFDQLPEPGIGTEQLSKTIYPSGASRQERLFSVDDYSDESDAVDISNEPSLRFSRKIWYEALCSTYASLYNTDVRGLTHTDRDAISRSISRDLRFLFRASNYWFSFFHVPTFFGQFFDPARRENMQPSLVMAALSLSIFWQSSEIEEGEKGRTRALLLREEAQSALEASFNAGSIDETLAQAAWLLALFEVCAHPEHSTCRSVSAIVMLDSIIRCLALTVLDADDPNSSVYTAGQAHSINSINRPNSFIATYEPNSTSTGCSCLSRTLAKYCPASLEYAPLWATTPAWNPSWSNAEIRKESSRRLCWAAISLAAGHVSYASANDSHIPNFYIADPSNFALLFSGESSCRDLSSSPFAAKDTVWALYDRSFVLWHICARMRADTSMSDAEKGHFAVKAWLEADVIESALNKHTCAIEKAYIFQGREYLFNTRMCISFDFQRYIPLVNSDVNGIFHRTKAIEWLHHQAIVAERFMHGLHTITGNSSNLLARRPFFVFWFMSQILRSLRLWQCDHELTIALDVCKAFLPAIDYLSALWPCDEQRQRYMRLRARLDAACQIAGVLSSPPANFSLPDPSITVL